MFKERVLRPDHIFILGWADSVDGSAGVIEEFTRRRFFSTPKFCGRQHLLLMESIDQTAFTYCE